MNKPIKKNIYSLRLEQGSYLDQDDVSWDSPESWLFVGILGGCGCGSSDELADLAWKILDYFSIPFEKRFPEGESLLSDSLAHELIAHILTDKDLLEHGFSVYGSWLTSEGKNVHGIIKKLLMRN